MKGRTSFACGVCSCSSWARQACRRGVNQLAQSDKRCVGTWGCGLENSVLWVTEGTPTEGLLEGRRGVLPVLKWAGLQVPWPRADGVPRKWGTMGTWGTGPNVESHCSAKKLRFYPRRWDLMLKCIGEREAGEEGRAKSYGTCLRKKKKKRPASQHEEEHSRAKIDRTWHMR